MTKYILLKVLCMILHIGVTPLASLVIYVGIYDEEEEDVDMHACVCYLPHSCTCDLALISRLMEHNRPRGAEYLNT